METKQALIAAIIHQVKGERSIYGIYHLLKGKRSAQTIQDGFLFSLHSYFGLFPSLDRQELEADVADLLQQGCIHTLGEDRYKLSNSGELMMKRVFDEKPYLRELQGFRFYSKSEIFWLRFCLMIQVLSQLLANDRHFYPITHRTDIQHWVKQQLVINRDEKVSLFKEIYKELEQFLLDVTPAQATIFVHQLSSRNKIGYTKQQLAEHLQLKEEDVALIHLSTIHKLMAFCMGNSAKESKLSMFVEGLNPSFNLTESARETLKLMKVQLSLEEIAAKRSLKRNTIEDHVVEIALQDPQFSLRPFVSETIEKQILSVVEELQTSKLREIKERLGTGVSYFMIRLVLAKRKVDKSGA